MVPQGSLKLDGRSVNCGKRPTVLNSNFDSWGGAFPGFVILNTKKISGLSTAVKLYIYSHECGHQFEGPDETKADLFAIRRGVKWGWLDAVGMEEICTFISTLKGDAVHPPGPQRCETMRNYYQAADRERHQPVGERAGGGAEPRSRRLRRSRRNRPFSNRTLLSSPGLSPPSTSLYCRYFRKFVDARDFARA